MNLKNCHITKKGMKELSHECTTTNKYIILNFQNIANIIYIIDGDKLLTWSIAKLTL